MSHWKGGRLDPSCKIKVGELEKIDPERVANEQDEIRDLVHKRSAMINEYARQVGDIDRFADLEEMWRRLGGVEVVMEIANDGVDHGLGDRSGSGCL
jgi:hypothetical protein